MRRRHLRLPIFGAALILTATSAVGWAMPAQAADVGTAEVLNDTEVSYFSVFDKASTVTVTRSGFKVTIDDTVAITPGTGCARVGSDTTKVVCTTSEAPTRVVIVTFDKNDKIINKSDVPMYASGGEGNDAITAGTAGDKVYGGEGSDVLTGGAGEDKISDEEGNDVVNGGDGDDWLVAGLGADKLNGGAGVDTVAYTTRTKPITADLDGKNDDGESGEGDTIATDVEDLAGGSGADKLTGNAGKNALLGYDGKDVLKGGAGDDWLSGDDWELSGDGADTLWGEVGDDTLDGQGGNDTIHGGDGDDYVRGFEGNDIINGDAGSDILAGRVGNDTIHGGDGDDDIYGEAGDDTLYGDAGEDELYAYGIDATTADTETDRLDGGTNESVYGDFCEVGALGTTTGCERVNSWTLRAFGATRGATPPAPPANVGPTALQLSPPTPSSVDCRPTGESCGRS